MHTCDEVLDLISLRLDGELDGDQERVLAEHLASCPECSALAGDLALHAAMPGMNEEPPAFIMEKVMARIGAATAEPVPFPAKKSHSRQWHAWGAAAAAVVVVATGIFALRGGVGGGAPSQDVTTMSVNEALPSTAPSMAAKEAGAMPAESLPAPQPSAAPAEAETGAGEADGRGETAVRNAPFAMEPPAATPPAPMPDANLLQGASLPPVSPLTVCGAAEKLYRARYAETRPDAVFTEGEDFVGYVAPDWSLRYVGESGDGAAYEFEEVCSEGETEAVQARYLVPMDASEIQALPLETAE